ncbi:MAG: hypothetical protein LBV00_10510 [Propionibacteriaceae bacterium]|jgi:hypothetical protein|nr:hypothetical protein [Propionibacteriaceae bacterium]
MTSLNDAERNTGAAGLSTNDPASPTGRPAPVFISRVSHSDKKLQRVVDWTRVRLAITEPRLGPYLAHAAGDEAKAIAAYHHNLRVSGAVYEDLAIVEIALRNSMDRRLRLWNSTQQDDNGVSLGPDWILTPARLLGRLVRNDLAKAALRVTGVEQAPPTHDDLLTHLTLGAWRYLLPDADQGKQYLWREALCDAFPYLIGQPRRITEAVTGIWLLRNRVAHLEPLTKVSALRRQVRNMRFVLRSIDPALEGWFDSTSRLSNVLAQIALLP